MVALPPRQGRRKGFTLIELLVVIAIIGVLLRLLIPALPPGDADMLQRSFERLEDSRTIGEARGHGMALLGALTALNQRSDLSREQKEQARELIQILREMLRGPFEKDE